MKANMRKVILLTGKPGSGKTTTIRRVLQGLSREAGGFYTEEIRRQGRREGFSIVTLAGQRGILAHVNRKGGPRVGKYGVNVDAINAIAVKSLLEARQGRRLVVIDEIGPMELLSKPFQEAVIEILQNEVDVLGSIVQRSTPFSDKIKALQVVRLLGISPQNREELVSQLIDLFRAC
jgi:nucleoside-triphosphatase THEP1